MKATKRSTIIGTFLIAYPQACDTNIPCCNGETL